MTDAKLSDIAQRIMTLAGKPQGVPFIRAYPDGSTGLSVISRPEDITAMANRFVGQGGRYLIAAMADGTVQLVAATASVLDGELVQMAEQTVPNGVMLPNAVDQLVRDSIDALDQMQ
jgi:hypothetical protein